MITETITREPLIGLWFGNFYRPAYDDRAFVDEGVRLIRQMGFNSVQLDSKAWEDFAERYAGGEASAYVAQQEYMMEAIRREGLSHQFMALYLNADNLYPNIRFSPPIYGESVENPDGSDGRWYRYWSEKAQESMAMHVRGLLATYKAGHTRVEVDGAERLPICSMWDPIVAPSFDAEGQARYKAWLAARYGSIAAFNAAYGMDFASFDDLTPHDYWYTVRHGENACYAYEDLRDNTPAFAMWADNMRWRADELVLFFAAMREKLHAVDPSLYLMPNMAQWSHFLNIDASKITGIGFSDLWDTAMRGIDIYRLALHVDMCHFYTVPVTPDGDPDAYVVSAQHAMIRAMNPGRPFLGGIYWGRFLYSDVYNFVSPAEIMGSIVASGAAGAMAYGYCGLDDGGVLHRMDEGFTRSLEAGNRWARRVIPKLGGGRHKDVAILFPSAMALLEPLRVQGAEMRRLDMLGWYKLCCDLGYAPDIIDAQAVRDGALAEYRALILPANSCYAAMPDAALEAALSAYAAGGGTVLHGARDQLIRKAFGLGWQDVDNLSYDYRGEGGLLLGAPYCAYAGEALATYRGSGQGCITRHAVGQGAVYSFGFLPGYNYAAKTAPHVPLAERNNELYPLTHMRHNAAADALRACVPCEAPVFEKNIEAVRFNGGWVVVNHGSHPVTLPEEMGGGIWDFQYDVHGPDGRVLVGHSAVFIEINEAG